MAAPKAKPTKLQQDRTRAAIQTTQLVKRLQNYALGENEANNTDDEPKPVILDAGRLKAIEILLRKSLPDLSAVQFEGELTINPLQALADEVAKNNKSFQDERE